MEKDRIEQLRDLAEASFLKGTPVAQLAELIADELEQQRLRADGAEAMASEALVELDRPRPRTVPEPESSPIAPNSPFGF